LKDTYKRVFNPYNPSTDYWKFVVGNIVSGAAAGTTSMVFTYPLEFARTRLALDIGRIPETREFSGMSDCLNRIY
jgi:solute carrier family 25 (adenine nucleotide translocator) protein 4/5/6/31